MAKKIIDISSYQNNCDYDRMASSCDGVIIRIGFTGYGSNEPAFDSMFETHYRELHKRKVPMGVYYFTLAQSDTMARKEAKWVLENIRGKEFVLPIYVDVEEQKNSPGWTNLGKTERSRYVATFCRTIAEANYFAGVYASKYWFTSMLDSQIEPYNKWVAQYNSACTYSGSYGMWQYSSSGTQYGANRVDENWAYIDFESIIRERGLNGLSPEVKEERPGRIDKAIEFLESALLELKNAG